MKVHHLIDNRATIISLSPHALRFSDGSVSEPQDEPIVKMFTLSRKKMKVKTIAGMAINSTSMVLNDDQLDLLEEVCKHADIVLVTPPMLTALRDQGVRDLFPNLVSFNATLETELSPLDEKVIDIENWFY